MLQITFDLEQSIWLNGAYELGIQNIKHIPSLRDTKLKQTIIAIVKEFFRQNPGILLYICETGDDQQVIGNGWIHRLPFFFKNIVLSFLITHSRFHAR